MTFSLNRNGSLLNQRAIIQLGQLILHDQFTVHKVTKSLTAAHLHFTGHPLVLVECLRPGTYAVPLLDPVIKHHMCPRGAEIRSSSTPLSETTQQLDLNRSGEILIERHAFQGLTMQHETIVAPGPPRPPTHLIPDETVDGTDPVM